MLQLQAFRRPELYLSCLGADSQKGTFGAFLLRKHMQSCLCILSSMRHSRCFIECRSGSVRSLVRASIREISLWALVRVPPCTMFLSGCTPHTFPEAAKEPVWNPYRSCKDPYGKLYRSLLTLLHGIQNPDLQDQETHDEAVEKLDSKSVWGPNTLRPLLRDPKAAD